MAVSEIFTQINTRTIEGLMFHSQLSDYFCFLGLKGFSKCQLYHYYKESNDYRNINSYYLKYCDKLIIPEKIPDPKVIPETWFQYTKKDVNTSTRKNAIQTGYEKWVQWEAETKKFYEKMYKDLIALGEIAIAEDIVKYIQDVNKEHAEAYQEYLELKAIDFDMSIIIDKQKELEKKYKKKLKEIELC